jgi:hypothetical protein
MKTHLDEGIVQDEHDCSGIPDPRFAPEQHLPNITDISDLGMPKTEFP